MNIEVNTPVIFDHDVGNAVDISTFTSKADVANYVNDILRSIEFEEGFDDESEKPAYEKFEADMKEDHILMSLLETDLDKAMWTYTLPGGHRQLIVGKSAI